jgi:micrococcal nuclease
MMKLANLALGAVLALGLGGVAEASICGGEPPSGAAEVRGPVLHVLDGERLCVALGPDPATWVPLRLSDATDPSGVERRGALMAASFGRDVTCRVVGRDESGFVGQCRTSQGSLGQRLDSPRIVRAGLAWR